MSGDFQLSQYPWIRGKLTRFVLFGFAGHAQTGSLRAEECVSQHFFLMSPMWSVILSVIHSLSLSLSLSPSLSLSSSLPLDSFHHSSNGEGGVTVMWWGYTDCQDRLLHWEILKHTHTHTHARTNTHTHTHTGCVPHKHTDTVTHACIHPY